MQIDSAYDDDSKQSYQPRKYRRIIRMGLALAFSAYAMGLIATIPANLVFSPPTAISVAGTIWHGNAKLPNENEAVWSINLFRSITRLAFAMDWNITGPGTDLKGAAKFGFASISLDAVTGRASSSLVRGLVPSASGICDGEARVDLRHFRWGRHSVEAEGEINSGSASCPVSGSSPMVVPPLIATLVNQDGGISAVVTSKAAPSTVLITASLNSTGHLIAELRPDAASVFPTMPKFSSASGPFRIETGIGTP